MARRQTRLTAANSEMLIALGPLMVMPPAVAARSNHLRSQMTTMTLTPTALIGALCPRVPGRNRRLMLLGGECYKCVIDGAACDAQAAERVRQFPGPRPAQQQRRSEAGLQQPRRRVGWRQPRIAGQPGEDGIGLREGVAGQRDLLPVPPAHYRRVIMVATGDQWDGDAGVDRDRHLRPASRRAKTTSSSTGVSPAETSTPSSSTSRAVRPAGTTCARPVLTVKSRSNDQEPCYGSA